MAKLEKKSFLTVCFLEVFFLFFSFENLLIPNTIRKDCLFSFHLPLCQFLSVLRYSSKKHYKTYFLNFGQCIIANVIFKYIFLSDFVQLQTGPVFLLDLIQGECLRV